MTRVYCDRCGRVERPLFFFREVEIRGYFKFPGEGRTFVICRRCEKALKKSFMSHCYEAAETDGTTKEYMAEEGTPPMSMEPPMPPTKSELKLMNDPMIIAAGKGDRA